MKLTTLLVALATVFAGAALTEGAAVVMLKPGAFSQVDYEHAKHWKIYAENAGTDLATAQSTYSHCAINVAGKSKKALFKYLKQVKGFEFQQITKHTIGINCIDCSPQTLGWFMMNKLQFNCNVKDSRRADWKPQNGHKAV
ncbi:uncharacterized protein UTRI_03970_B [Ustilago trichophora]|uniref:Uncharacterized protein n=1 Tax=Ustilago trichophora TaxID=86804 RepID=A0A5C3E882_9BASI|nr:uncharacterized protein UTRI_03970_B [Ustilago trichophora]